MIQEMIYFELRNDTKYRFFFKIEDEMIKNMAMKYIYDLLNEEFPYYVSMRRDDIIFEYFHPSLSEPKVFEKLMTEIHFYMSSIKRLLHREETE